MKSNRLVRLLAAGVSLAMIIGPMSGCREKDGDIVRPDSSAEEQSDNFSYENETNKLKLNISKDITQTLPGTAGAAAQYEYKYKLQSGDFCVVKDGISTCKIVLASDAKTIVRAAANDLVSNIQAMTGATIQIIDDTVQTDGNIILVGASDKTRELGIEIPSGFPENEGFRVISSANVMILAGNDDGGFTGTQFAVTAFLESIGFGWYGDSSLWTVVPKASTVYATECDFISKPTFGSRYTRVNYEAPSLGTRWYLGGYNSEVEHKFETIIPVSKYSADHPEYYALSKGTRSTEGKRWWQICLSNPEVQQIASEHCIDFLKENPSYVGVSIGQNDGSGDVNSPDYANWCECDNCKHFADNFTEAMMKFTNIVGEKVAAQCPGKTVMYYAYFATFEAPKTNISAADNALLMMCKQGGLTRFIRNNNLFNSEMGDSQFSNNFASWKNLGYKHIGIYEWNCPGAASDKWKDSFWVQGDVFIDNAKWFAEQGVDFIKIDQGPNAVYERSVDYWDIRWPLWYVNSIAMYNCNLTFEEIMRPACNKLYGGAGDLMYQFYKTMNNANKNCDAVNTTWGLPEVGAIYTQNYIYKIDSILAKALVEGTSIGGDVLERIENQMENWTRTKSYV